MSFLKYATHDRHMLELFGYRLQSYQGPRPSEDWKREKDLNKCTQREKDEILSYGLTIEQLMAHGYDRGMVHHALFGYKYTR